MKHFIVSLLVGFWLLGPHAFSAVNARNGVSITTASTINGRTPNSAINGQTITGGGSPAFYYPPGINVSVTGTSDYAHTNPNARLAKIVLASGGTVTKLGIYIGFVNASTDIKLCLFDSSRAPIGSGVTTTIASGDNQWHDFTVSESVSSGTYYVGYSSNVGFEGALNGKYIAGSSGDSYGTSDASTYANFPGSLTGLSSSTNSIALRLELTP